MVRQFCTIEAARIAIPAMLLAAAFTAAPSRLDAQQIQVTTIRIGSTEYTRTTLEGVVGAVRPGQVQVVVGGKPPYMVDASQQALTNAFGGAYQKAMAREGKPPITLQAKFTGKADLDVLRRGHIVEFVADLDVSRTVQGKVPALTILSLVSDPGIRLGAVDIRQLGFDKEATELYESQEGVNTWKITGEVRSFADDQFSVAVPQGHGRKTYLQVPVTTAAKVEYRGADLFLLAKGDKITVEGYTVKKNLQLVPQYLLAEKVTVQLSNPLVATKTPPYVAQREEPQPNTTDPKPPATQTAANPPAGAPTQTSAAPPANAATGDTAQAAAKQPADPLPARLVVRDNFAVD